MSDRSERLRRALATVRDAGSMLLPIWNPHVRSGIIYDANASPLQNEELHAELEMLANDGSIERIFIDRLSLCAQCGSHALNIREICLTCYSPYIEQKQAILHFRCGYVGSAETYMEEKQGRRCPKCRKILQDIGTDHDNPGYYFLCKICNAMFQLPETGAVCLSCGAHFSGTEMLNIGKRDIFAYRLLSIDEEAIRD